MDIEYSCPYIPTWLLLRALHKPTYRNTVCSILQARQGNMDIKITGALSPCLRWVINEKVKGITPVRSHAQSRDAPWSLH